jgi:hypothetical protein
MYNKSVYYHLGTGNYYVECPQIIQDILRMHRYLVFHQCIKTELDLCYCKRKRQISLGSRSLIRENIMLIIVKIY